MRPFLLGKSLRYHVFHSEWLQDWMTKLPKKEAGGGLEHLELFPPVPLFQKSAGENMGPAKQPARSALLKWLAWLLGESWALAKGVVVLDLSGSPRGL